VRTIAHLVSYHPSFKEEVLTFFSKVFSELGRDLDLISKEGDLADIPGVHQSSGGGFWILRDGVDGTVIGTVALRRLDEDCAELKRFYHARSMARPRAWEAIVRDSHRSRL
jgi:hypothetical protein